MNDKASDLAWKHAIDGQLKPGLCPRCNVFVDGKLIEKVALANLEQGYVEQLRIDLYQPGETEVPRVQVHGFIDIDLLPARDEV